MKTAWKLEESQLYDLTAALQRPDGGFTVDLATGEHVSTGYAVSVHPECEVTLGEATLGDLLLYLALSQDTLSRPNRVFGGWRDPSDGRVYLDVTVVVESLNLALALGRTHDQLAVYDFATGQSVSTYR